jgi:hypothetical protein
VQTDVHPAYGVYASFHQTKVTFTLTPQFHGKMYLEALMVKQNQFWFDQATSSPTQFASVFVTVLRS